MNDDHNQARETASAAISEKAVDRMVEFEQEKVDRAFLANELAEHLRFEADYFGSYDNALTGLSEGLAQHQNMDIGVARADITERYNERYHETPERTAERAREADSFLEVPENSVAEYREQAIKDCQSALSFQDLQLPASRLRSE